MRLTTLKLPEVCRCGYTPRFKIVIENLSLYFKAHLGLLCISVGMAGVELCFVCLFTFVCFKWGWT